MADFTPDRSTVQISFAGCGGLYHYELGVAAVIQEHFDTRYGALLGGCTVRCHQRAVNSTCFQDAGQDVEVRVKKTTVRPRKRQPAWGPGVFAAQH